MKQIYKRISSLGFLFIFISSIFISTLFITNLNYSKNKSNNQIKLSTSTWGTYSIEDGQDLYQDHSYTFSTLYYDDSDYTQQYSSAKLETQYLIDSDRYTNESILGLDTLYNEYPNSISINQGTGSNLDNLNSDDGNLANFSSTINQTIASNFTTNYGSEDSTRNLEYIDSDYSQYSSETEYDIFDHKSYNATYDFNDEEIGDYTSDPTNLAFVDSAMLYDEPYQL